MDNSKLAETIDAAWEKRETVNSATKGEVRDAVEAALDGLDAGKFRVAEHRERRLGHAAMAEEGGAALLPPAAIRRPWMAARRRL